MFGIELVCSDEACAEVTEAAVFSLDQVETMTCEGCGCTLQQLAVWEVVELRPSPAAGSHELPRAA